MSVRSQTVAAVGVAAAAVTASGCGDAGGSFSPAGSAARELQGLFWAMVILGGAVFVLVVVAFVWAARARRLDEAAVDGPDAERRRALLVLGGGIALPVVVLVPLTIAMLVVGDRLSPRLGDAYEIEVIGHQFWWEVRYPEPGAVTANEVHIPTDTRVRVVMRTEDVIHSFWVPQLAGKIDMIPGQTTEVILETDEPGRYLGYCAEFCGLQHANMRFLVVAQPPDEFAAWLEDLAADAVEPTTEAAQVGREVFGAVGCAACHTVRGTEFDGDAGPDLTHFASRSTIGAVTYPNRRGYLAGWVIDPQAAKPGNPMPPTPMTGEQLLSLLEYLEGLE